jgi:DNA-binding XRE family transcriptional regulator
MSVAAKKHPIKISFKSTTPKKILREITKKYSSYIEDEDDFVDYFNTDEHNEIANTLNPGLCLKHLREVHGYTQKELGIKIGNIKASRVSDWENGHRNISKENVKKIADIFNAPVDLFI